MVSKDQKVTNLFLVYRVIVLVLTLLVSNVTTEGGSFSTIIIRKLVFIIRLKVTFSQTLIINIETKIATKFNTHAIIDDFRDLKEHCVPF